jgi:DNA-binding beta-propeller fold protein YncE
VLEVDTTRYRVLRSFELGGWPQGVVVSPDGTMLYAANERQGLDAIRLGTGTRVTRLDSESGAVSLALSPDRRFLYTGLVHAGQVGVIEVSSLTRRGSFETGGKPGQIAFDGNGRVIVPNTQGWVDILPVGGLHVGRQAGAAAFAS